MRVISPSELAAGAAHTPLLDAAGRIDSPVLGVDLDEVDACAAVPGALTAARVRALGCDRILVGVAGGPPVRHAATRLAGALDLTVADSSWAGRELVTVPDPAAALGRIAAAVAANPTAALMLASLLRGTETSAVPAALDVESLAYSTLLGGAEYSTIAVLGPDDHRDAVGSDDPAVTARLASAGRFIPGVDGQIRDDAGTVLAVGEVGELWVRGPQVSGEYAGAARSHTLYEGPLTGVRQTRGCR